MAIGKRILDELYVHFSALDTLSTEQQAVVSSARARILPCSFTPNVVKLNLRSGDLSLLAYEEFESDPFPTLAASWRFPADASVMPSFRTYRDSINPPVLHRKEMMVKLDFPRREQWAALTRTAEELGLFDETNTIGFRLNWIRRIASKGFRLEGDQFLPIGNAFPPDPEEKQSPDERVLRHLTALTRNSISAPVQLLIRHGLLSIGTTFFDYGCGRGGDVAALHGEGFQSDGWDPHFEPDSPRIEADVVNLGFVVNVIEDPA
jgi:hypothetical protein